MKKTVFALLLPVLMLSACKKQAPAEASAPVAAPAPVATAPAPVAAPATPPAELSAADKEMARKKDLLAYGTMEDQYINDPRGQWASSANASSSFSKDTVKRVTGAPDGSNWLNNNQNIGFDWLELNYDKPVSATEVRIVLNQGYGSEAITRVELQDTDGKWNKIWEGVSEVKADKRGNRTWFVRTFEKTPYKVKAVKYTIANNLYHGYKEVDAAQLVGD